MGLLEVGSEGMRTLAAQCRSLGVDVGGCAAHPAVEVGGQATAHAVKTAHHGAGRAAQAMAARLRDIAMALEDASSCYVLDEGQSTAALHGLISEA